MSGPFAGHFAFLASASRGIGLAVAAALTLGAPAAARAQPAAWGTPWTKAPSVVVLLQGGDARAALVNGAVTFWNRIFADIGSPFRLGPVTRFAGAIAIAELSALSDKVLGRSGPAPFPAAVQHAPGSIVVALSDGAFISFTVCWPQHQKALVAIRSDTGFPLALPNVTRNVIAHEFGHAIGLGHNGDPRMLMCGRPAPCRPEAFQSPTARYFPLTTFEKDRLQAMYPPTWKTQ